MLLVVCKGQGAHFATGGSPTRYKGKKKKKKNVHRRAVKRLPRAVGFPPLDMLEA